jgi:hypothetical protein
MTEEQKAAIINARCATAMIRAMGMQAENDRRKWHGEPPAYNENNFLAVIEEEGTDYNSVIGFLHQ